MQSHFRRRSRAASTRRNISARNNATPPAVHNNGMIRIQPGVVKAARWQIFTKALHIKRLRWARHIPNAQFRVTLA
jgi:hypothetical protein